MRRVDRLYSGAMLENSSITNGRMRFIGGLLRIDSGGRIQVIGEWRFFGNGAITGDVVAEGKWTQNGDWEFNGNGDLAGDVALTGNFDLTGKLTAGNVRVEDGKIYVGAGTAQIVIDGATGKILAGDMTIDPSNGGSVQFPGGAVVRAATSGGVRLEQGNYSATVTSAGASIGKTGLAVAITDAVGIQFVGLQSTSGKGVPDGTLWADSTGRVFRADS
jgi:hypothetical protein